MSGKLTPEQVMEFERNNMVDALLDGSFELSDAFLERYAGEDVRAVLSALPERDRAFVLDGAIDEGKAYFPGGIASLDSDGFWLPCDEIEWQFEGNAEDVFDDMDDWTIHGDCAYLYVGYGLCVPVDMDKLREGVADWVA